MISRREPAPGTCHSLHEKKGEKSYNTCFITAYVMGLSRTPCSRAFLEKPMGSQLFKKKISLPPSNFIEPKGSLPRSQKQDFFPPLRQISQIHVLPPKLSYILTLFSHLCPRLSNGLFLSGLTTKNPVPTSIHRS